ncbi:hypothetical protein [Cyclobacterium roseum]|uniref:hypothetical protein n=1 Tax=Cyclobacterium roseum TaxID=2666137 RepID=UPI001F363238|nr:hypothetical protein [Cyclobacterium roseum]
MLMLMPKKLKSVDPKPERIVILGKEDQYMVTIIKKGTPKEEIKRRVDEVISKSPKRDITKYAGKLKTGIDPLAYQRQMRDEWE